MSADSAPTTALLGFGDFGTHLVDLLAARFPGAARTVAPSDVDEVFGAGARSRTSCLVVALWRPAPAFCERVDGLAHAAGVPWLLVSDEHPALLIGPYVAPGAGPCFRCYSDRRVQHDTHREDTRAVYDAYDKDPEFGPSGHLPSHVRITAAIAHGIVSRPAGHVGRVTGVDKRNLALSRHPVVSRHGCHRCGAPPPPRDRLASLLGVRDLESTRV
ncbi:TOMM precursor leader peptide-binding protein [Streptomyces sp. NBC_01508]|uniref:TOMM precursor leader peptide-binding protein n=1 Tax=Streptomyces sp. NBC_01508 TaxID=2903888 RepID=UPI00386D9307